MRKTKIVKTFTFVNAKGTKLYLNLGIITDGLRDEMPIDNADKGFRWCFVGENIPMPVRSGYWFNGMPEHIMLDWLKANGWALHITVNTTYGRARIYELPAAPETETETKTETDWIPVSSGKRPEVNEHVHVTYLSYPHGIPMCDFLAYWTGSHWCWADDGEAVNVEITAWKPIGEPYKGDAPTKAN
jgi:hypothetical protein